MSNSALGYIEEGETIYYTPSNQTDLDDVISVITLKDNVYLHLDSDLDLLSGYYTSYNIVVKFDTVPVGSTHSQGDIAYTLSLTSPDHGSITLDESGSWTFDLYITTTATSVNSDQNTTLTITVLAS